MVLIHSPHQGSSCISGLFPCVNGLSLLSTVFPCRHQYFPWRQQSFRLSSRYAPLMGISISVNEEEQQIYLKGLNPQIFISRCGIFYSNMIINRFLELTTPGVALNDVLWAQRSALNRRISLVSSPVRSYLTISCCLEITILCRSSEVLLQRLRSGLSSSDVVEVRRS